ncbi:nucleolin [Citrus sinensis]|uniref:Nucleolin n=1 Tax=Citrus sinensis TaxID=2711 RepID=A0ACB8KXW6_CITSI|nr:nucleolin [Citrus sinensis]
MPSDDAKAVKKEDEKSLSCMLESRKKKPTNGKVKKLEPKDEDDDDDFQKPLKNAASRSKVKKENNAIDDDDDDHKPISLKNYSTSTKADSKEVKKKKIKGEEKKSEAQQNGKKKERKVFDLPGQKREPPEERDPLRIFYETLYKQVPHSEMAQLWMMESGLLSFDEAKKVFERKQTKNKFSSPIKAISAVERNTESVTVKEKPPFSPVSLNRRSTTESKVAAKQSRKRKVDDGSSEDDSDDDFSVKKVVKKPKAK